MRISVIVPAFNQRANLSRMLETLAPQVEADPDCEAVIVDDGSSDDTYRWSLRWAQDHPRFRTVTHKNSGPGRARNFGVRHCAGDVVAFIDQDCLAQPGWITAIRNAFQADPALMGLEGRTITEDDKITPVSHYVTNDGGGYWTCNVSYRRTAFDAAGGFDPAYVVYAEDTDIALKVKKLGAIDYCPAMQVLHPVCPVKIWSAARKLRLIMHSELLLYSKHQDFYAAHREGNRPARYFYYYFLMRHFLSGLKAQRQWLWKNPGVFARFLCLLIVERVYLLILFEWFVRQRREVASP